MSKRRKGPLLEASREGQSYSWPAPVWRLTRQAQNGIAPLPDRGRYFIDCGKTRVGLVSEIFALFEYSNQNLESDWSYGNY